MSGARVAFVDRDGTLIEEPHDEQVDSLDKIRLLPGVFAALQALQRAGYRLVMVSNQDGLGTERYPQAHFDQVQAFVLHLFASQGIEFDRIFICPHYLQQQCACRKPRTGLVTGYLQQQPIDYARSAMIGDRVTDLEFARELGIRGLRVSADAAVGAADSWPAITRTLLARRAQLHRKTRETDIQVELDPEREAWRAQIDTLAEDIHRWTGNNAGIVEISTTDLPRLAKEQPPVLAELRRDAIDHLDQ